MVSLILINVVVGAAIYLLFKRAGVIGGKASESLSVRACWPLAHPLGLGLLVAAVIGVSSAGALFQHVDAVPPFFALRGGSSLTSIVLFLFFVYQLATIEHEVAEQFRTRRTWALLLGNGVALAAHFGAWVASLDQTTLTHSLLFVTAHPLVIVVGMMLLAPVFTSVRRPRGNETYGAIICFIGAAITLLDAGQEQGDQTRRCWAMHWRLAGPCSWWATSWWVVSSGRGCPSSSTFPGHPHGGVAAAPDFMAVRAILRFLRSVRLDRR